MKNVIFINIGIFCFYGLYFLLGTLGLDKKAFGVLGAAALYIYMLGIHLIILFILWLITSFDAKFLYSIFIVSFLGAVVFFIFDYIHYDLNFWVS